MRKNKYDKKSLGLIYTRLKVKKSIISSVLNFLKKGEIEVFSVKEKPDGYAYFSVKSSCEKKVFAILKEVWYNESVAQVVSRHGLLFPFYALIKNWGILFGAIAFILITIFSSSLVLGFTFTGDGVEYKREVLEYLKENGVSEFKSASGVDFSRLSKSVLASNANLSFVSIKKEGFRLIIDLRLHENKTPIENKHTLKLTSTVYGKVVSLKVYRGTPLVKENDLVSVGDVLVDGYYTSGEERVQTFVLASVVILTEERFTFQSKKENDEDSALIFAEQALGEDYAYNKIQKTKVKDGYVYSVSLFVERVMRAT